MFIIEYHTLCVILTPKPLLKKNTDDTAKPLAEGDMGVYNFSQEY